MSSHNLSARTRALSRTAVMAALYVVLTLVSIRVGNLRITLASLPVVLTAVLCGPLPAAAVALLGEFFNQLLSYGLTVTTLLWLLPPAVRGLTIGLAATPARRKGEQLEARPLAFGALLIGAALLTTACNTLVIWLDSMLYGYYSFAYVFGDSVLRFVTGIVTAVLVAVVARLLLRFLRSQPIFHSQRRNPNDL